MSTLDQFRVTGVAPDNTLYATTWTLDAAIVAAKTWSLLHGGAVVRDRWRIRAIARNGRATWLEPCEHCNGVGHMGEPYRYKCVCDGGIVEGDPAL